MKYIISVICSIFILFIFSSCNKKEENVLAPLKPSVLNTIQEFISIYEKPHDGEILITNQNIPKSRINGSINYYNVSGSMFNNRNYDRAYNIGPIFIDGNEIPFVPNSNNGGSYGLNEDFTYSGKKFLKGLWGKKISVRIESNSKFSLRTESDSSGGFYVPMSIEMEATFLDTKQYSLSGSSSITWQPDPNNPSGKVYLFAVYEGPDSKEANPSFSDSTVVKFEKELSDNGSYTLSPNELGTGFPIGSRMSFVLARGSYQTISNSNGTEVILQAVTYSTSNIIAVKQ